MPTYVLRSIQMVAPGKWDQKMEQEKRFDAVEARLGASVARRYQSMLGGEPAGTFIKEYEYDSLAAMEEALARETADPEHQALVQEAMEEVTTLEMRFELYTLLAED